MRSEMFSVSLYCVVMSCSVMLYRVVLWWCDVKCLLFCFVWWYHVFCCYALSCCIVMMRCEMSSVFSVLFRFVLLLWCDVRHLFSVLFSCVAFDAMWDFCFATPFVLCSIMMRCEMFSVLLCVVISCLLLLCSIVLYCDDAMWNAFCFFPCCFVPFYCVVMWCVPYVLLFCFTVLRFDLLFSFVLLCCAMVLMIPHLFHQSPPTNSLLHV